MSGIEGSETQLKELLKSKLRQYQDFPSKGILFEDILPIFQDPKSFQALIDLLKINLKSSLKDKKIDVIVGLESRGFLFGPTLALQLGCSFVPVRKAGKLPGKTIKAEYVKEYGKDVFEMQEDAISPGQNVVIVDDIIATGGSAYAAGELVMQIKGNILQYVFLLELNFLNGRSKLDAPVLSILSGQ